MPQTLFQIKQLAILAAKKSDWAQALKLNEDILAQNPDDVEALNRLGQSYLQLNDCTKAKKTFSKVLKLQKTNKIALRNLEKIKNNQTQKLNCFATQLFIDEPGKAKNVVLHRLAGKPILQSLAIGQECQLVIKNRYISIETKDGEYIGALPEDISFRLSNLIKTGNQYLCYISSCNEKNCQVYIKESVRSAKNEHQNSFALNKNNNLNNFNDHLVLEEDIPVEVISVDEDSEKVISDDIDDFEEEE